MLVVIEGSFNSGIHETGLLNDAALMPLLLAVNVGVILHVA